LGQRHGRQGEERGVPEGQRVDVQLEAEEHGPEEVPEGMTRRSMRPRCSISESAGPKSASMAPATWSVSEKAATNGAGNTTSKNASADRMLSSLVKTGAAVEA
jgi:hypothetical protein